MVLLIILIIGYYLIKGIDEAFTPPLPQITDTTQHLKTITRLHSEKARQDFILKLRKAGTRK